MGDGGKGSLAALIALKLVCCGGLLLAMGAFSLGSLLALLDHPLVQVAGIALVLTSAVWWVATRHSRQDRSVDPGTPSQNYSVNTIQKIALPKCPGRVR